MPTAPRQNDVQRGEEHRPPVPAEAPAVRRLGPAAILALQRTAGNQAVARYVTAQLRRPPQRPKLPPASDQASPENRQLAGEIDDVDRLDDTALDKRRAENATQVAATDGAAHADAVQKRDALEYVTSHRRLPGPKLDVKQWRYVRNDQTKRRQFLNALVAERANEDGSFESAMQGIMIPDPLIVGDLAVIRADADRFKREFKGQARINAERMLRHSNQAIAQLLTSYGIPTDSATIAAERILKGGGVAEEAAAVIRSMKRTADDRGGANEAAPTTHRLRLAQWVERLKTHQARARDAAKASNLADMNVSVASTPADQVALKARKTLRRERDTLAGLWIQAERVHPVLAAYRTGDPLEKIELGGLDSHDVDTEMQTVLERVLPKVVSIARAHALIRNGTVSPLSLTPVVAMTRANMFVPPGSIRAAIVRDLMEEAEDGQSGLVMLLSFALVLVTLVPSGGASLGIAAGVASAGLATYSALQEFQTYENNKTLIDTDLDRARALSDEEPSLAGFAMSLVGIGLEGLLLVHAFKTAVQIRRMAMAGDKSKRLQELLDELNEIGKKHNQPDLGKRVLDDAPSAKPREPFSDAEVTQDMPAIDDPGLRRPPTAPATRVPVYRNRDEVRTVVTRQLVSSLKWGDGTMLPKEFGLLDRALAQNTGPVNARISKALPHVVKGLRDPELYGEVMADAWALAKGPPAMDINAALEQMAQSGGAPIRYIERKEGVLDPAPFFKEYAGKPGHFIDLPLVGDDHGAMSHLVQDLVVDRALLRGRQGMTGVEFRGLLGQAEGNVALDAGFATKSTKTFVADETKMRTGDYLWRMLYDNTGPLQINRPEELGLQLFVALGVR